MTNDVAMGVGSSAKGPESRSEEPTRVTWLGHASVLIELAGLRIVTDPVLRERMGVLRRRRDLEPVAAPSAVDAVLISHLHHDHADLPSLHLLSEAGDAPLPVLTEGSNSGWVRRQGLHAPEVSPAGWHRLSDDVEVRLVPAVHDARPMPHRPNGAVGMLIRGSGVVVWFAGDTALYSDMDTLPSIAEAPIDLALLPVGGWGPRLSAGHMGAAEAAEAAVRSGARAVMPIHYGTLHPRGWPSSRLDWTTAPGDALPAELSQRCSAEAHVLPVGGTMTLT